MRVFQIAGLILPLLVGSLANAETLTRAELPTYQPGDILLMSAAAPMPGSYEAHPAIRLKDGSVCDLLSLICIARAEDEFGSEVYAKRDDAIRNLVKVYRSPAGK